ncbi:MAG TPA: isochorismatase family protein [Rhizobium sp.]
MIGSARANLDPRLEIAPSDIVINKKMPSAFHETHLQSLATFHGCDTVIVTGGSTSGCVRATAVDALSRSYRVIVPEECVADLHESPHFANLYDLLKQYAAVVSIGEVLGHYAPSR